MPDVISTRTLDASPISTLALLASLPGPPQPVRQYIEETDAPYEFAPNDATAVNGVTSVAPTGGTPGRWLLKSDRISVAPLGGVLDDTARLQTFLDACAGHAILELREGEFRITSPLLINQPNQPMTLKGISNSEQINGAPVGRQTILAWYGAAASPVVSVSASSSTVTIQDLAIENRSAGASVASHGILAVDSDELRIINVLMFPVDAAHGFSTAAIELGGAGHDLSKAHLQDLYIRNCVVGILVKSTIHTQITHATLISNTTCLIVGSANTTAYSTSCIGCTFEARTGQTGARVVRAQSVTFVGCQFDAWDNTHFGFEILSTAALADVVTFTGCRFTGNTVPSGLKVDFAAATVNVIGTFFSGFTTSGILNANNKWINVIGSHSDDAAIPLIDSTAIGSVRMVGNDVAGTGLVIDSLGGSTGVRIPSFLQMGGGTQPTTGLLRFPKPSEQSVLATFRREASAIDVPFLRTDIGSDVIIGETDVGVLPSLMLKANTDVQLFAPSVLLREAAGAVRATWTIGAATAWDTAAATSMEFKSNGTTRFKYDATGLSFYGVATVARQVLATGTGKTVDNVITALQNLGLVSQV